MKKNDFYKNIIDQSVDALKEFIYLSKGSFEHVNRNVLRESENIITYLKKFLDYKEKLNENENELKKDAIAYINVSNINELISQAQKMGNLSPYSMLVSLLSGFEYFIKQLLTTICIEHPQTIKCIDVKLDYNDFALCENKEDIRQYYINLFLEELFRPSLKNVFDTIEKKFKICKFKDIKYYKELLLIAEFRNIIVHNNGNTGLIFKSHLKENGLNLNVDKYFNGDKLRITPEILLEFINLMTVSAIEICIEFIDHYLPKSRKDRDNYLYDINNLCLSFLDTKQKRVALDAFSIILKRKLSPKLKNIFVFNNLLSKKDVEKYEIKENDFSCIDWDYCNNTHYFAKYVLLENFEMAMNYCNCEDKTIWEEIFQCWPMCKPLINSSVFSTKYSEIFGCNFVSKIIDWTNTENDISNAIGELNKMLKETSLHNQKPIKNDRISKKEVIL